MEIHSFQLHSVKWSRDYYPRKQERGKLGPEQPGPCSVTIVNKKNMLQVFTSELHIVDTRVHKVAPMGKPINTIITFIMNMSDADVPVAVENVVKMVLHRAGKSVAHKSVLQKVAYLARIYLHN